MVHKACTAGVRCPPGWANPGARHTVRPEEETRHSLAYRELVPGVREEQHQRVRGELRRTEPGSAKDCSSGTGAAMAARVQQVRKAGREDHQRWEDCTGHPASKAPQGLESSGYAERWVSRTQTSLVLERRTCSQGAGSLASRQCIGWMLEEVKTY